MAKLESSMKNMVICLALYDLRIDKGTDRNDRKKR